MKREKSFFGDGCCRGDKGGSETVGVHVVPTSVRNHGRDGSGWLGIFPVGFGPCGLGPVQSGGLQKLLWVRPI
jgi:hypothetical protein